MSGYVSSQIRTTGPNKAPTRRAAQPLKPGSGLPLVTKPPIHCHGLNNSSIRWRLTPSDVAYTTLSTKKIQITSGAEAMAYYWEPLRHATRVSLVHVYKVGQGIRTVDLPECGWSSNSHRELSSYCPGAIGEARANILRQT